MFTLILLDKIRRSHLAHAVFAVLACMKYVLKKGSASDHEKLALLLEIIRRSNAGIFRCFVRPRVAKLLPPMGGNEPAVPAEKTVSNRFSGAIPSLQTTIILKEPRKNEKGVLFIATERDFSMLLNTPGCHKIFNQYLCVVASSWSPPDYTKFVQVIGKITDPLFVVMSNQADPDYYSYLTPWIRPLPILTCDWLNPQLFDPKAPSERDIDIIMVAGWGSYKRHWLLFKALKDMPSNLRIVMVGRNNEGRTVEDVKREARDFGVKQDIQFMSVPVEEAHRLQCRSKIAVQFSIREGACIAVTEALMSNTPVAMMADAHVGAKKHINEETGVLCAYKNIGKQLNEFLETFESFHARKWAVNEVSCHRSWGKLNAELKSYSLSHGQVWEKDIAPFYRNYFRARYLSGREEFSEAREDFRKMYGLELGKG